MTDRLLELAEKAGVEIYETATRVQNNVLIVEGVCDRPRLDIAHELLNTLGASVVVRCSGNGWCEALMGGISSAGGLLRIADGTFEECVIALAERAPDKTKEQP